MKKEIEELIKERKKRKIDLTNKFNRERFDSRSDRAVFQKRLNMNLIMINIFIDGLLTASEIYERKDNEDALHAISESEGRK